MRLGVQTVRRGDRVIALANNGTDVPEGARGVVVDVYSSCCVVAFRWGPAGRLRRPLRNDLDGEKIAEMDATTIKWGAS